MSLLDNPPNTIRIYPSVWGTDPDGNEGWRPGTTPVDLPALVQPISSTELAVNGQQLDTLARVITRTAPAGPWDRVEWDGRTWDILGEPETRRDSPTTTHTTFTIHARGVHRNG